MSADRTDDDTWDLATSVGATATMVAAGRARATRANLLDDRYAEPLVRAVGVDFFTRWATGELAAADGDVPGSFWGMQQTTDLLTARTRYFDAFLTDATDAAIRQVVILASGLDARGYRLAWPAGTVMFEIDQPEVLAFKAATLAELKAAPTAEVRTVPIDLRQDWPAALRDAGFDVTKPCAWTAEGLLPFLPAEAQDRLLANITALSVDGSRLASEVAVMSASAGDGQLSDSMDDVPKRCETTASTSSSANSATPRSARTSPTISTAGAGARCASRCGSCWPMRGCPSHRNWRTPRSATTTTACP